jgi:hypothetical protein
MDGKMEETLIAYIRAFLHNENVEFPITPEVVALAKKHQVQNFLWLTSSNPDEKKQLHMSVAASMAQEYSADELLTCFEEQGLYVMPLKGICTRKRYPDVFLRTMSDLDILCKMEQAKEVHLAMQSLGYKNHVEGRKHDSYSRPPYVHVEVHRDMVDGESPYWDYYRDIWERCSPRAGFQYVYEMSTEDEYIFNLVHLAGHFRNGGISLRFLVDVYIYEQQKIDRGYIAGSSRNLT